MQDSLPVVRYAFPDEVQRVSPMVSLGHVERFLLLSSFHELRDAMVIFPFLCIFYAFILGKPLTIAAGRYTTM
jgi:hypothetical protein